MKLPSNLDELSSGELYKLWLEYGKSTEKWRTENAERLRSAYTTGITFLPNDPVPRCGYFCLSTSWIYRLVGKADPFIKCCMIHDIEYGLKRKERKQIDREFYQCMKLRAGGNVALKAQARLYYGIASAIGPFVWR